MTGDFAPRGAARTASAVTVGLEAAVLAVLAVLYVALGISGDGSGELSFALAGILALAAVGLQFLARGLWSARRWATSPSITWQVLQGLVGAAMVSADRAAIGVVAIVLAVVALGALTLVARGDTSAR